MRGNGWCSHVLKALAAYLSMMCWRRMGRFSTVGLQGRVGGSAGGSRRSGQEHGESSVFSTPLLVHLAAAILWLSPKLPMEGKSTGMRPKSAHASRDKKVYGTVVETYANWRVLRLTPVFGLTPENSNNNPPIKSTGAPVTVLRFVDMGKRSMEWRPRCASIEMGTVVSWAPVSAHESTLVFLAGLREGLGIGNLRSAYAALSIFTDTGRVGLGMAS